LQQRPVLDVGQESEDLSDGTMDLHALLYLYDLVSPFDVFLACRRLGTSAPSSVFRSRNSRSQDHASR
jgi:hypothetical protein